MAPPLQVSARDLLVFGYGAAALCALLSAVIGVYTEKVMKDGMNVSIHWQNLQLYCFGVIANGVALYSSDSNIGNNVFEGFNIGAWISVCTQVGRWVGGSVGRWVGVLPPL